MLMCFVLNDKIVNTWLYRRFILPLLTVELNEYLASKLRNILEIGYGKMTAVHWIIVLNNKIKYIQRLH
jgi:hypothetical protein